MRPLLLLVVLCVAGCKPRVPHANSQDLATVLDGGVAMMEHVDWTLEHNQTIWPVGPMHDLLATQEEDPLLLRLHGREALRALLQGDPLQTPREQAQVLALLQDFPSRLRYWSHLLQQDPNDLEAALEVARGENEIGQPQRGLELLAHVTNPNPRWHGLLGASWMEYMRCSMLLQVGRTEEARHACEVAIQLGDPWGHVELAMIEADLKHGEAALAHARAAWANPGPSYPAVVLAAGLALRASGKSVKARAVWAKEQLSGSFNPALFKKAQLTPDLGAPAWERELWKWNHSLAAEQASDCGHYYLDLNLTERAEKCFALSEKLEPGPAEAQRLVHLGESDPKGALARALVAVKARPHVYLDSAIAWLSLQVGDPEGARHWAAEALARKPRDVKATGVMWSACADEKIHDLPCVIEYRKRMGLPTHLPGVKLPGRE